VRRALFFFLLLLVLVPATVPGAGAATSPLLIQGRLEHGGPGIRVYVAVDDITNTSGGRVLFLASALTTAAGRFTIRAPYTRKAATAAQHNGGAINFSLDALTPSHQWVWEFSRRWNGSRWTYAGDAPMRGALVERFR
jgi:hypothetical protein